MQVMIGRIERSGMASYIKVRPITFVGNAGGYRVLTDTEMIGHALLAHCRGNDPTFIAAAKALLEFQAGKGNPEDVRAMCVSALSEAGVFVKDDRQGWSYA